MIGSVVGARYRILRELGEGGAGHVYLAEHTGLQRKEAVKVLKARVAMDPKYVMRFRREARATNRVQHPNIVGIYDFGQLPDGRMFLAMEYAEGESLRALLDKGPLPVEETVEIAAQLARAIEHAHTCGVVHRDIKPANMIVTHPSGAAPFLKVLDFGLAKIIDPNYMESMMPTAKGDIFGTAAYMAPELFGAQGNDPRSDLYAVGCVIYEMLVGKPPFEGRMMELLHAHTSKEPTRPSKRNPGARIPPALDAIVLRCLDKSLENRFQSGAELIGALAALPRMSALARGPAGKASSSDNEEDTEEKTAGRWRFNTLKADSPRPSAPTEITSEESLVSGWRTLLKELAGRLQDAQIDTEHTGRLSVAIAKVIGLDDDVARTVAEQKALSSQEEQLDQSSRERGASLRFALGELEFDCGQLAEGTRDELEFQIGELSDRYTALTREADEQTNKFATRGIELAAISDALDESWALAYDELEILVDSLVPICEDDVELAPLIDQYDSTRSALGRAQASALAQ